LVRCFFFASTLPFFFAYLSLSSFARATSFRKLSSHSIPCRPAWLLTALLSWPISKTAPPPDIAVPVPPAVPSRRILPLCLIFQWHRDPSQSPPQAFPFSRSLSSVEFPSLCQAWVLSAVRSKRYRRFNSLELGFAFLFLFLFERLHPIGSVAFGAICNVSYFPVPCTSFCFFKLFSLF